MLSISKSYSFDSAHQLYREEWTGQRNKNTFGKCSGIHGHTYLLTVEIAGTIHEVDGMVLNYFDLDKIMKPIVIDLDHKNLNDVFGPMLTTSENMVEAIVALVQAEFIQWKNLNYRLQSVTLSETPKTTAKWTYEGK